MAEAENLKALINSPELDNFLRAVHIEAVHQVERWSTAHDRAALHVLSENTRHTCVLFYENLKQVAGPLLHHPASISLRTQAEPPRCLTFASCAGDTRTRKVGLTPVCAPAPSEFRPRRTLSVSTISAAFFMRIM